MKKIYLILTIFTFIFTGCAKESTLILDNTVATTETSNPATDETTSTTKEESSFDEYTTSPTDTSTEESTTEVPTEPDTEAITEAPTEPVTEAITEAPTETATIPPTIAPTQAPTEVTTTSLILELVDIVYEESNSTSDYKYGIKKITSTYDCYYIYSDGSKEFSYSYTDDSYDYSGYAATDAELMEETLSLAAANMEYYNEILTLVNEIRAKAGVNPLTLDTSLCQAATMRSLEMNYSTIFSHTRPNGNICFSVFNSFSISNGYSGENIAAGQPTPSAVVKAWENSPGHYSNMVNENFTKLGVGMSDMPFGYGIYWTQLFTN